MIRNYFITAWRNLWKSKVSSTINLVCLAIGMSCCMLIALYIKDELSYDRFHKKLENIYRVNWTSHIDGQTEEQAITPVALGPVIASDLPQVQSVVRLFQRSGGMEEMTTGKKTHEKFHEQNVFFCDSTVFSIFSLDLITGSPKSALSHANSIVLTDRMARKYFGDEDPLGKTLLYDTKAPLKVTAVVKEPPVNSDVRFDFLVSFETVYSVETPDIAGYIKSDWTFNPAYTFCLLKPGQQVPHINDQLNRLLQKYGDERKSLFTLSLQPLKNIHLYSTGITASPSRGNIRYIYSFAVISLLILLIAGVNFVNLATARASTRTREVGMRKVLGAEKYQLVTQFLGEALLLSFGAFLLALLLSWRLLPLLNGLTGKQLQAAYFLQTGLILPFVSLCICTGLLAGLYPAVFIARFRPIPALKGRSGEKNQRNWLRKTLLVIQFSISAFLISSTLTISLQLDYMRNKPLGFKKEQVLVVPIFGSNPSAVSYGVDGPMRQRMNAFAHEVEKLSRVKAVTAASALPGQGYIGGLVIPQGYSQRDNRFAPWASVDYNFISTMGLQLLAGRDFSRSTGTDHISAFIISESAAKEFNLGSPAEAVGKSLIRGDEVNGKKGQIIGVVKDYIFNTLDRPMQPLVMDVSAARFTQFAIPLQPDHIPQTIQAIHEKWDAFFPERVFEYSFLDSDINAMYSDQDKLSQLMSYFALIAIVLSCLGLFSLASFLSVQRTREIGIRKVLGAGVAGIMVLLSRDFLMLALLAVTISIPLAWYAMHKWIENYAYHISISWWIFAASALCVTTLTVLTTGLQSIKTALSNPVKSLKTE